MTSGDHTSGRAAAALFIVSTLLAGGCYVAEDPEGDSDTDTDTDATAGTNPATSGDDTDGSGNTDPSTDGDDSSTTEDSDTDDTTGVDPPDPNASLESLIGALCTWDFQCCTEGEIDYRLGPFTVDADDCTERYIEQLYSNDDVAETERGDLLFTLGFAVRLDRSAVDADAAADCQELVEARDCAELADAAACEPAKDDAVNPCDLRNLFEGQQAVGELCSSALASLGFDIECVAGSSCEEVDGTFVCVDKGLVDDFCEADFTCDEGLYCDIETGRCREKSGLGDSCTFEDPDMPDAGTETLPCQAHLTCDPDSGTCVQFCASGYDCEVDEQCAAGQSCIPVDIDDNTYTYCLDRGDTNGDRCDTDHDCVDDFHCEGDSCVADRAQGTACGDDGQCQAGLYCDLGGSAECEIVLNANATCSNDRECNPTTTLGCMTSDDGTRCRTALLDDDDACTPGEHDGGNWCRSGVCEDITDDGTPNPQCHPGAGVGDACDDSALTLDSLRCARGLYCDEEECAPQLDAGGDCGDDGPAQCLNGSCAEIWEGDYCTDAVPTEEVGEALTCDGRE